MCFLIVMFFRDFVSFCGCFSRDDLFCHSLYRDSFGFASFFVIFFACTEFFVIVVFLDLCFRGRVGPHFAKYSVWILRGTQYFYLTC